MGWSFVSPGEVAKQSLRHNACALIVAHNHPSGRTEPKKHDRLLTFRLKTTLQLIDVSLIDHLIVGAGKVASMAELGLMGRP